MNEKAKESIVGVQYIIYECGMLDLQVHCELVMSVSYEGQPKASPKLATTGEWPKSHISLLWLPH